MRAKTSTKILFSMLCFFLIIIVSCKNSKEQMQAKEETPKQMLKRGVRWLSKDEIEKAGKAGADLNEPFSDGYTALMTVARGGNQPGEKYVEIIDLLVSLGADTEIEYDAATEATNHRGMTALMIAAKYGKQDAVRALLENDADPNAIDKKGYTALHWACGPCNRNITWRTKEESPRVVCTETARSLLNKGAAVNADSYGVRPIDLAADERNPEEVAVLLDNGARASREIVGMARNLPGRDENSWQDSIEETSEPPQDQNIQSEPEPEPAPVADQQEEPPLF